MRYIGRKYTAITNRLHLCVSLLELIAAAAGSHVFTCQQLGQTLYDIYCSLLSNVCTKWNNLPAWNVQNQAPMAWTAHDRRQGGAWGGGADAPLNIWVTWI